MTESDEAIKLSIEKYNSVLDNYFIDYVFK